MTDDNQSGARRRAVLKGIGGAAVSSAFIAGTASSAVSAQDQYEFLATKRGSFRNPLTDRELSDARRAAFETYIDRHDELEEFALVETGQDEDTILVGYNIILDQNGRPREQFAARKKASENKRAREEIGSQSVDGSESLRQDADEMLAEGVQLATATDGEAASDCEEDTCTDEMTKLSATTLKKTYEVEDHPRSIEMAGKAVFTNEIFYDKEGERGFSHSHIRLQSGRLMCNSHGEDDYCYPSTLYGSGHRNKEVTFRHNWDQRVNSFPEGSAGVIDDYSPRGQDLTDITVSEDRSVQVGATIDDGGAGLGANIGWSQTITDPATNYRDLTNRGEDLETLHKMEMQVSSDAAKDSAEGYVGTLAHFEADCANSNGIAEEACEIEFEFVFAPPERGFLGTIWGRFDETNSETFKYLYECPCTDPPCPTFQ